ncbi:MAG TPA: ribosome-associated translation inhibitor RaiA [Candidatus Sumerlaeota bacterium]|nr:ribosome-associated translation inhibitor RaiA [Candidatus Sumerlaeota bacterium]
MSPRIMCHHHELSDLDRDMITRKIGSLRKFFERIREISVILDEVRHECHAELLIFGPQLSLRVKETDEDMRTAFEGALNKAERILAKTKDKKWGGKKHAGNMTIRRFEPISEEADQTAAVAAAPVELSVEHVEPEYMTLEQARDEVLRRKNGMLVFINQKTDEVNILHRSSVTGQLELVELTLFQPNSLVLAEAVEGV